MPSSLEPPGLWLMPGLRVGCPGPLVSPELKMAAGGPATVLMANAYNVLVFFFFPPLGESWRMPATPTPGPLGLSVRLLALLRERADDNMESGLFLFSRVILDIYHRFGFSNRAHIHDLKDHVNLSFWQQPEFFFPKKVTLAHAVSKSINRCRIITTVYTCLKSSA